jgi:carboxypeptidase A2
MSKRYLIAAALLGLAAHSSAQSPASAPTPAVDEGYRNHKLVQVQIRSAEDLIRMETISPDCWNEHPQIGPVDFRMPPERMAALDASGLTYRVLNEDLQVQADAEYARLHPQVPSPPTRGAWFSDYKDYDTISAYIDTLVALRPDLARRIDLGLSLEGRHIFGIRISNDAADGGRCKPGVFFNSCQHAREWITPMVNMYCADALVRRYDTDSSIHNLVNRCEFFIVPVSNPDGYVYTWANPNNRYWRKNRRGNGTSVWGVDNNRNWGYQWGGPGSDNYQSSETYRGTAPFSEPETQVLRDFVLAHPNIRTHNDIHSAAQLVLWPWGYTAAPCPDQPTFQAVGVHISQLIAAVHGYNYTPGPVYTTIYPAAGVAVDWVYGATQVLSFSYEMRGPGFGPPPDQILPGAQEALPGLLYQAQWAADQFPFVADWNHDCLYSVADFLAFLSDFAAGAPVCDLNSDGSVNVQDFLAFLAAYSSAR